MLVKYGAYIGLKPRWIRKVHGIILSVSIAIEGLRITQVVTTLIRIRLVEAVPFARVAPHHCFVATICVSFVIGKAMRLESLVAAGRGLPAPGIQINCADDAAVDVSHALALGHRVFMHPVNRALLLDGNHLATCIHIATRPGAAGVDLCNYLTTQDRRTQVVGRCSTLGLL